MRTSILVAIVTLALSLADVNAANLRQLTTKHDNSPEMGRMEAHKTTVARMESHTALQTKIESLKNTQATMESHKTTQAKMESQFKLPFHLGKRFSRNSPQQPATTTAPPQPVTTIAPLVTVANIVVPTPVPTNDPTWYDANIEQAPIVEEPEQVGSYPRNNWYSDNANDDY